MTSGGLLPGGQGAQRPHGHHVFGGRPADVVEGRRQGALLAEQVVGHHQGEGGGHREVGQETDEQRGHDGHGDGLLGVLHLLTCGEESDTTVSWGEGEGRNTPHI